ncbi:hypothetical protein BHE74_00058986 [Ensete ventricosum]|nr:hypothetical protein BHE74_00058986 [Ensete ventricosum]
MLQERPFGNSGAEHHPEPNHPQPTEEATIAVPTLNYFWRMITDPGFPSPVSNPVPFVVTVEVFLDLSSQVQALAGMMHTIVPYLPQLVHLTAHQSLPRRYPANGVTSSPESGDPARGRAATTSGRQSLCSFPDPDASPITKSLLRSNTDRARPWRLIVRHR